MSVRTFLFRVLLFLVVLVLLVGVAEAWLRSRLDSDARAYKDWRDPRLFTWQYKVDQRNVVTDDHDKLALRWGLLRPSTEYPHALLGWCGDLDSATLLPKDFIPGQRNGGVVLLGAGWAEHMISGTSDSIPPGSYSAITDLSIAGFSLDQDLLLLEHTRSNFHGAQLLLHIDLDHIDHLQRAFVGRPKPWFTLGTDAGELHGVPVETDVGAYLKAHPADPGLFTYHLFRTKVLHDTTLSNSAVDAAESELRELSKRLLSTLVRKALQDNITVSVYLEQKTFGALTDHRQWALQDACREFGIACHVLREEADAVGDKDQERMLRIFLDDIRASNGQPHYTSLSQLKAMEEKHGSDRTPLERRMVSILTDASWREQTRAKALPNNVSFAMMVERDARSVMEYDQR